MRKLLVVFVCLIALGLICPVYALAAEITVTLNGNPIQFSDTQPILEQGRVLVPLRSIFEKMGAEVNWNGKLKQVEAKQNSKVICLPLNGKYAFVNGVAYEIDVLPRLDGGRTFVPLRFLSQALGANVNWDKATSHVAITTQVPSPAGEVWGYYVDYNSYTSLENNLEKVTGIMPFSYKLDSNGQITETVYFSQGQSLAQASNIPVYALVFADDPEALSQILATKSSRSALVEQALDLAVSRGYQGVNLDFEKIKAQDRENFNSLVQELAESLHSRGLCLSLSVPAKSHDQFSWTKAYDYAALGKWADKMIIMAYDQHYSGSEPGPVAALSWVESVVKYATSQVDGQKILLGIGLYGYDWPSGQKGKTLDLAQVKSLPQDKLGWSEENYAPYLFYTGSDGVRHEVWFENQKSVTGKLELVKKYKLAGIALWRLGLIPAEVWEVIGL